MVRALILLVLFALAALLLPRPEIATNPSVFHRPDDVMLRGEAKFAETFKSSGELALIDLAAWQNTNAVLKAKMGTDPVGDYLTSADLPRGTVLEEGGIEYLILPGRVADELAPEAHRINLKELLGGLFRELTGRTIKLIAVALVLLIAVVLVSSRRRVILAAFAPPLAAVASTYLTLGLIGESLTLFHILSFFVILGLGVDYAIFRNRVVFYSFLTSSIGFGLLAFTSFPPTAAIGKTLAIGLIYAYLFSLVRFTDRKPVQNAVPSWSEQKEQAAGRIRLWLTFTLYRVFGKSFCKICAFFVVVSAYPFLTTKCPFKKALSFAFGLLDKLDACTLRKNLPKMTVIGDTGWMKGGAFLLSTHVGTIEVLPALENVDGIKVHAFQQMTHNKLFTEMFVKHLDRSQFVLHAVEELGVETACEMQEAIRRGEMVLMAGDRDPASGGKKGVFRFAKLMEAPVYAITCIRTGWNAYTVNAASLDRASLQKDYETFLYEAVSRYPTEHFEF